MSPLDTLVPETTTPYAGLAERFDRISRIDEAAAMLHWDAAVTMPSGAAESRGGQLAVLAGLSHAALADPRVGDLLDQAEADSKSLSPIEAANLLLMRRQYTEATALPARLVEARATAHSACETVWRTARRNSDFATVAPKLAEVVKLTREAAGLLGEAFGCSPYDALLESFQRGMPDAQIAPLLEEYARFLKAALPRALERQARSPDPIRLTGDFAIPRQEAFAKKLLAELGFDFDRGRLDQSAHPFSGGTPFDLRITTRYDEADPTQAILGLVHELGHATYEGNLPRKLVRQPVGRAAGMAAHESQSLITEMQAGRSDHFLGWLGPRLHRAFGGDADAYTALNLARLWRRVHPGFIRVEADELTYPGHVIVRWRLERALIAGELEVEGLPAAWNEGYQEMLGVTPPDDRRGCLQDIHWYDGAFGYFPSYTMGAMAAAQLMEACRKQIPDVDAALERGELGVLFGWVSENVHARGSALDFEQLMTAATGRKLDARAFEAHLARRYLD